MKTFHLEINKTDKEKSETIIYSSRSNSRSPEKTRVFQRKPSPFKTVNKIIGNNFIDGLPSTLAPVFTTTHNTSPKKVNLTPALTTRRTERSEYEEFQPKRRVDLEIFQAEKPVCLSKKPLLNEMSFAPNENGDIFRDCKFKKEPNYQFSRRERDERSYTPSNIWRIKKRERGLDGDIEEIIRKSKTPKKVKGKNLMLISLKKNIKTSLIPDPKILIFRI